MADSNLSDRDADDGHKHVPNLFSDNVFVLKGTGAGLPSSPRLKLDNHDARMFALAAIQSTPPARLARYTGYLKALAPPSIRRILETMMKTVFKDPWVDGLVTQGLEQGLKKGRAEMLLDLLEMRFSVPDDIREQVETCADTTQIKTWFRRAFSAASLDGVFAELAVT
jgi:hypothetical protein